MDERLRPIETPFPQKVDDFKRRYLPLLVWSVVALLCAWLLTGRASRFEFIGLARAVHYEVSADTTGQLEAILFDVYDTVEAGDLVAKLDDEEVSARLERSRATIRQLGAQLDASRSQMMADSRTNRADWHDDLRRFETDEEDRRLAGLELRVTIESDEVELEWAALELERAGPLLAKGLIGQQELDNIRLQHDTLQTRIDENRILLAQTEQEYRTAVQRREAFERSLPSIPDEEPLLGPLRAAIEVENGRLQEIQARRRATTLRSPVNGRISSILCRRGQTVVPGEPILTIADETVTEILTYLDESDSERAHENAAVLVASLTRPEKVAESIVVRLGPDVEMIPQRLWREPSTPQYGRAVVIAAVPGLDLIPGELLSVKVLE